MRQPVSATGEVIRAAFGCGLNRNRYRDSTGRRPLLARLEVLLPNVHDHLVGPPLVRRATAEPLAAPVTDPGRTRIPGGERPKQQNPLSSQGILRVGATGIEPVTSAV